MQTDKLTCVPASAGILPFAPEHGPKLISAGKLGVWKTSCAAFLLCAVTSIPLPAQTFNTLVNFNGRNGAYPSSIVQGADGRLWGTTSNGRKPDCGSVFKMIPSGAFSVVFTFDCVSGYEPGGLVLATDGDFYGVTFFGGSHSKGTVFKLKPRDSKLTVLSNFDGTNGASPVGSLVQGMDGNFYGATYAGGSELSYGTVFRVTPSGTLGALYDFDFSHGAQPYAGLIEATDGYFYGTTYSGGTAGNGTVFKIARTGVLTVLYDFGVSGGSDGIFPIASLTQGRDGDFYGTTPYGGADDDGTVFKITPSGTFITLHAFAEVDGRFPAGSLIQATDGNFYGTTAYGGTSGVGTIFRMSAAGVVATLHNFDGLTDGALPSQLMQGTDGILYGLTGSGGTSNKGTVFSLDVGLGPFVETLPTIGKEGTKVTILGTNLTGTTSVTFNGTAATFTVVSSSEIRTTVPIGATTGKVIVTAPSRSFSSNLPFRVRP